MRRSHRRDDGAVLVLFALLLVFIVTLVAFGVDLGNARFQKRDTQSATDLASLAAGFHLAGNGSAPPTSRPADACVAAIRSFETNLKDFPTVASAASECAARFPANATACFANTAPDNTVVPDVLQLPNATTTDLGPYTLTITYPVPGGAGSLLRDSRFTTDGINDGTHRCERMAIELTRTNETFFASVIGQDAPETDVRAIVRGALATGGEGAPAFLMLERTDCGTLWNSANGSGNLGIIVENNGVDPGIIHSDSNATTSCSGNTNDAYAIYGSPLSDGTPSTTVKNGTTGRSGIISAAATNSKGAGTYPGGLSHAPTVNKVYSRIHVDKKYNDGANLAITNLHAAARPLVSSTSQPAGSATMACNGTITQTTPPSTSLYVDCNGFNRTVTFSGFTTVTFSASTDLKQDNVLTFPDATTVVVRGQLSIPKGRVLMPVVKNLYVGDGISLSNNTGLAINSPTETSCAGREGFSGGNPIWTSTARVAIFGGSPALANSGSLAMCQTTVYFAGPKSGATYAIQQTTSGGTCTADLPCPRTTSNAVGTGAQFVLGSGTTLWSAPNQYATTPPTPQGLEDLAMWTEGSGTSEVKSGATLLATGVFFAPNTSYEIRSPATGNPRDAQFIARRLSMLQGTLRMQPDKNNSITVPVPGGYGLIR